MLRAAAVESPPLVADQAGQDQEGPNKFRATPFVAQRDFCTEFRAAEILIPHEISEVTATDAIYDLLDRCFQKLGPLLWILVEA